MGRRVVGWDHFVPPRDERIPHAEISAIRGASGRQSAHLSGAGGMEETRTCVRT